jgi:hypothetical protein
MQSAFASHTMPRDQKRIRDAALLGSLEAATVIPLLLTFAGIYGVPAPVDLAQAELSNTF